MIKYIIFFLLFTTNVYALGIRSTTNCGVDYFRYCSQYAIGSDEVRECFRANRKSLSSYCIDALIADGEITQEDIDKAKEEDAKPVIEPEVEEVKPVEETVEVEKEEPAPVVMPEVKPEPEKTKTNILQYIAKKVAAKLKEPTNKPETIAEKVAEVIKEKPSRSRKVQVGGKWDGFPLYLDWNENKKNLGGELTPYGYEDRLDK